MTCSALDLNSDAAASVCVVSEQLILLAVDTRAPIAAAVVAGSGTGETSGGTHRRSLAVDRTWVRQKVI